MMNQSTKIPVIKVCFAVRMQTSCQKDNLVLFQMHMKHLRRACCKVENANRVNHQLQTVIWNTATNLLRC